MHRRILFFISIFATDLHTWKHCVKCKRETIFQLLSFTSNGTLLKTNKIRLVFIDRNRKLVISKFILMLKGK